MSNALAISAVTMTLRQLLEDGLEAEHRVTMVPPDKARDDVAERPNRINLFLYQVALNPAWRNMDIPRQTKPGETGSPPLALNLYYLLTAYGENDLESKSHDLLGRAMSVLHDHCLLSRTQLEGILPAGGVHQQLERLRITPQPLSLEEISKLWTTFQTQYRISVAYEVSVVLIESTRPTRTPLPVLTRGQEDIGVQTLLGGSPLLDEIRVPLSGAFVTASVRPTRQEVQAVKTLPSAQLGDEIALIGQRFAGDAVRVVLERQPTGETFEPSILKKSGEVLIVKLPPPGDPADPASPTAALPTGFYLATVIVQQTGESERHSNSLSFALAPTITLAPIQATPGDIQLTLTTAPMIHPDQRARLLFHDGEVAPETTTPPATQPTNQLGFKLHVPADQAGEYVVRLRVDGVDSIPIDRQSTVSRFADDQKLKVA